ncbi:SagB/ThcOx family dehydrogenase [Synechococcales cyanobacterium C]|uniref:SagB/ThcOx family dehydrogenase n=2 Tax=Petrachloros TaxID=2918834 RepID=A0A8K1ZXM7_9CYAN|nr:SagB/ThcOx family dehydrogenase [Petrachloros mirabilis]NCJ05762.1 SagB/ThcOx family dehydrogenase [Petrachloros mirabilis ULC683]
MSDMELSFAQHYHERTKYAPQTLATKSRALDFSQQPALYKDYKLGTALDLKPYLDGESFDNPEASQWQRLSRLLYCTYGITGMVPYVDAPFYMRAAPSAGGLYPAELYLIAREGSILPAGLYNYQVATHSLLRFWDSHVWSSLQSACLWHPALEQAKLAVIVTAVFMRSAWRYEDRAYRRIFLDCGHVLGNLALAASIHDYRPHLIAGFVDAQLNQLLYVDPEQEGAIAALALADLLSVEQNLPPTPTVLPSETDYDYPHLIEGQLLPYCHHATEIVADPEMVYPDQVELCQGIQDKYNFPFCLKVSAKSLPIEWGAALRGLEETLLKRRSTRRYTGGGIAFSELSSLLDFTYQPQHYLNQNLDGAPDFCDLNLIETFVVVSEVTGLDSGCYYYAVHQNELRQIRFKNFRRELHYLCLQQDLGRDAAAVVFHTADLEAAIARYGDRAYRYLHLDAGHLGQRLNLAAIRLGLGVSGIGGFFDDLVNEVLGLPPDEAVLYITTLGRPPESGSM